MIITEAEIDEMFAPVEAALDATAGLGAGRGASRLTPGGAAPHARPARRRDTSPIP